MEVTSERYEYDSMSDTILVTFDATNMGQNSLFTSEQGSGCEVNPTWFDNVLTGDGTYIAEYEVLKEETGYAPWYVAFERDSNQLISGCVSEAPDLDVGPNLINASIVWLNGGDDARLEAVLDAVPGCDFNIGDLKFYIDFGSSECPAVGTQIVGSFDENQLKCGGEVSTEVLTDHLSVGDCLAFTAVLQYNGYPGLTQKITVTSVKE